MRTRIILTALAATAAATLAACASSTPKHSGVSSPGGSMRGMPMQSGNHDGMGGMHMPSGDGLTATANGYTLDVARTTSGRKATPVTFTIDKDGKTVTQFDPEQTKLMHFYLIRSDLTGFQHLHPSMAADGTWTITPAALQPGAHRLYVQFLPHADAGDGALVLSQQIDASGAGAARSAAVPAPSNATTTDGYTVTVTGTPKAGSEVPLKLTVTRAGTPVTDLQPYLDTYAHVTAIHEDDLAFAHLHPTGAVHGNDGGPTLTVNADLPHSGTYRMFVQFQTAGLVHTAGLTIAAH
ncbi:MAG: hypothetical protein ACR2LX_03440 [Jatrophihabitans sp.]